MTGRTDYDRWANLDNHLPTWDERTRLLSRLIDTPENVIEFGAGRQFLKKYLPPACIYQTSDIVDRGNGTLLIDLNGPDLPRLRWWEYAVFGGVVEYVSDVPRLVTWLTTFAKNVVMSYNTIVSTTPEEMAHRTTTGWLSHLTGAEVEQLFIQNNYRMSIKLHHDHWGHLYRFTQGTT